MYPPVRINGEEYGCGNRLDCNASAAYSVAWDALRFTGEDFAARAEALMQLKGIDQEGCPLEEGEGVRCRAGSTAFWMTWDGRMLPCGMMPGPETYPLEVGFDAAWDELRSRTAQLPNPTKCVGCKYRNFCSVCSAVCVSETGRFDGVPEYVCRMTEQTAYYTEQAYQEGKGE